MERCAYLVNSTPKYYYLLPLHFTLLKRYAPGLKMPLFLATEEPNHPTCKEVAAMGVELIPLAKADAGFLDSRRAALEVLKPRYEYVLPVQEDFLLDRTPDSTALEAGLSLLKHATSVRLMPCPGPGGLALENAPQWAHIPESDTYSFTFQATLWKTADCCHWYTALCNKLEIEWPRATTPPQTRLHMEIRANFAENTEGQRFFREVSKGLHVGWRRAGSWSNAVYLSPWPYRPTAIVQGKLEPWAAEMAKREGFTSKLLQP
jgi:hypothetical protein